MPDAAGGAIFSDHVPVIDPNSFGTSSSTGTNTSILQTEVYYPYSHNNIVSSASVSSTATSSVDTSVVMTNSGIDSAFSSLTQSADSLSNAANTSTVAQDNTASDASTTDVYMRSEYAPAFGMQVSRVFNDLTQPTVHA